MLWRGITEGRAVPRRRTMIMAGHQDQKFVCYPISAAGRRRGRALINWIAELHMPPSDDAAAQDWNRAGRLERLPAGVRRLALRLARRARR